MQTCNSSTIWYQTSPQFNFPTAASLDKSPEFSIHMSHSDNIAMLLPPQRLYANRSLSTSGSALVPPVGGDFRMAAVGLASQFMTSLVAIAPRGRRPLRLRNYGCNVPLQQVARAYCCPGAGLLSYIGDSDGDVRPTAKCDLMRRCRRCRRGNSGLLWELGPESVRECHLFWQPVVWSGKQTASCHNKHVGKG